MTPEEKRRLAQERPAWMYAWDLGDGVVTPLLDPELASIHATRERMAFGWIDRLYPGGLQGHACLDVACNEGFFSHLLWRRGATVTGIDVRQLNVRRARLMQQLTGIDGARLRFEEADLYHFEAPAESFEIGLFLGILYHLEDPVGALRRLHGLTRRLAVIETQLSRQIEPIRAGWGQTGVLFDHAASLAMQQERDADTNNLASVGGLSFIPNRPAVRMMLQAAGFREVAEVAPPPDANPQYLAGDRGVFLALK